MGTKSFYGIGQGSFYGGGMYGNGQPPISFIEKELGPTSIISFNDGLKNKPLKKCVVDIDPVQDLHGYDSPWPAGGGKNICGAELVHGVYGSGNGGFSSHEGASTKYIATSNLIPVVGGETYTISWKNDPLNSASLGYILYYNGSNFIESVVTSVKTFTVPAEANYVAFDILLTDKITSISQTSISEPQLELGSSATSYTPYSNICPITGRTGAKVSRTGKNLLDDTGIRVLTSNLKWSTSDYLGNGILLKKGVTYTVSCNGSGIVNGIYIRPANVAGSLALAYNKTFLSYTPQEDVEVGFDFYWLNGRPSDATHIQLELGSIATAYEPYSGNVYDISWQTEAGTIYGGTLDVTRGVLTVDMASVTFDGSDDEGWWDSTTYNYFSTSVISGALNVNASPNNFLSNLYTYGEITNNNQTFGACLIWAKVRVRLADMSISLDDWKDMLEAQPMQVIYPLATPQTYQLTPQQITTLLGENNVWADTGDIEKLIYLTKK